jgi:hypothetical protein
MTNADFARVRRYKKNDSDSVDCNKKLTFNQIFLSIRQNQLTEVIEALESVGIKGDIAIFILANLQAWEGKTDV